MFADDLRSEYKGNVMTEEGYEKVLNDFKSALLNSIEIYVETQTSRIKENLKNNLSNDNISTEGHFIKKKVVKTGFSVKGDWDSRVRDNCISNLLKNSTYKTAINNMPKKLQREYKSFINDISESSIADKICAKLKSEGIDAKYTIEHGDGQGCYYPNITAKVYL